MTENLKDYRVVIRIKNNRILEAMEKAGIPTVADLSRRTGIRQTVLGTLINLKIKALKSNNQWTKPALKLAKVLKTLPEDLFVGRQLEANFNKTIAIMKADEADLVSLEDLSPHTMALAGPHENAETSELKDRIAQVFESIPKRQARAVAMHIGLATGQEETYETIGQELGVSRTRAQQLCAQGLRKLQMPARARLLREYFNP